MTSTALAVSTAESSPLPIRPWVIRQARIALASIAPDELTAVLEELSDTQLQSLSSFADAVAQNREIERKAKLGTATPRYRGWAFKTMTTADCPGYRSVTPSFEFYQLEDGSRILVWAGKRQFDVTFDADGGLVGAIDAIGRILAEERYAADDEIAL